MAVTISNENNANNTTVGLMRVLAQLNTFMLWQVGWTDQIIENSHTSAVSK